MILIEIQNCTHKWDHQGRRRDVNVTLTCEPPIGIEPMTYALRVLGIVPLTPIDARI